MKWSIPLASPPSLDVRVKPGHPIYILGPNGSGKSALVQNLATTCKAKDVRFRRIPAHRRNWLEESSITITPAQRQEWSARSETLEAQVDARFYDHSPTQKHSAIFYDLIAHDNSRARSIAELVDSGDTVGARKLATDSRPSLDDLNDLLAAGGLLVAVERTGGERLLARHRNSGARYDIAEMSDGERSAVLLAADVITAGPRMVFLIDEPERHLHRSIIEPFLLAVFSRRSDCAFVIATYEVGLPAVDPNAQVLMARSCQWGDKKPKAWDVDLLPPDSPIPDGLRRAILGAGKTVLFVEGQQDSLDRPLYEALFPDVTVIPVGSCREVQSAVRGMSLWKPRQHHPVRAFGLVDKDDREDAAIDQLKRNDVFVLSSSSVEGLYCCADAIAAVSSRQAATLGDNEETMLRDARSEALKVLAGDDLEGRMAAQRCERIVRHQVLEALPGWRAILKGSDLVIPEMKMDDLLSRQRRRYRELCKAEDLDQLVWKYSIKHSPLLDRIAKKLGFQSQRDYCRAVVSQVRASDDLRDRLQSRVPGLARAIAAAGEVPEHDP